MSGDGERADPGPWITCPGCGTSIPCTVQGHPYPHTCED